ncbi:MAG: 4Fe-4S binding protein [Lachnospiraceae bacterium]|nr:4Fe-4S binding protein [Lachnospiraceae bacterium]
MTPLKKRKIHAGVRAGIQLMFFILMPSAFTTAFAGVKYIFVQLGNREPIEFNAFIKVLSVLLVYTAVFGRFFCGYACAFGSLGDAVRALYMSICKKMKKKPVAINETMNKLFIYVKYLVLLMIVFVSYKGMATSTKGMSPWDVFSMLRAGNIEMGAYIIGTVLLVLILIGMAICERFFCRFLCPMGAVFTLIPSIPYLSLRRTRTNCINGCSACKRVCPCNIELSDVSSIEISGECIQCGKCRGICPKQNVKRTLVPQNFELCFTIIRAAILVAILIWAGL